MKKISNFYLEKAAVLLAAGFLTVSSLVGCNKKEETTSKSEIRIEAQPVEQGVLEITTDYIATLSPNLTVDVVPLVMGTVEKVPVKVGDRVSAGDLLCQLDDTSADLSVRSARDTVNTAEAGKDAAQIQARTARIQANSNIKALKKALKAYKRSLKTAERQLEKIKNSKSSIKHSQVKAKEMLVDAKTRYKTARALLIQFDSFLTNNPDCKTTAGLLAAATAGTTDTLPSTYPPTDAESQEGQEGQEAQETQETQGEEISPQIVKQKQAQALLKALTQAGLTVEYISNIGVSALKEDAADTETAYSGTTSGLAQIDTSIASLKSTISQLKGQITSTEDNLKTAEKLADASDAGTDAVDAQIEAAKTGVEAAKYQKDLYRLTAPIDGIVDAVNVKKEGMATQGMPAFTISEKDSMIASFYVTEDVKNFLMPGDAVHLIKNDEETEELGRITSIGTAVDSTTGLFKVEAEFITTGQKQLSSGTSVKVSVVSNAVSGELLIPYDSVYYDDGQAYVYTITDGAAHRTDVETGLFNDDYIVVTSGLNAGDQIITTWASGLKDGAKVTVTNGEDDE